MTLNLKLTSDQFLVLPLVILEKGFIFYPKFHDLSKWVHSYEKCNEIKQLFKTVWEKTKIIYVEYISRSLNEHAGKHYDILLDM